MAHSLLFVFLTCCIAPGTENKLLYRKYEYCGLQSVLTPIEEEGEEVTYIYVPSRLGN